jgi:Uma2 family endonuclease
MSALTTPRVVKDLMDGTPLLCNGDRLSQPEFHRRYLQYPDHVKFELIGGIVYMASPLSLPHSNYDGNIGFMCELYAFSTPGTHTLHNATTILGEDDEPQPDLGLRILPEYGGQSRNQDKYVGGAVELVVEVAVSSRAIDLHAKRDAYKKASVIEYLVVCVEPPKLIWHHFPDDTMLSPDKKGVIRSNVFPGLWIHAQALLDLDTAKLRKVVEAGIASRPHAAFVRKLERQRKASS